MYISNDASSSMHSMQHYASQPNESRIAHDPSLLVAKSMHQSANVMSGPETNSIHHHLHSTSSQQMMSHSHSTSGGNTLLGKPSMADSSNHMQSGHYQVPVLNVKAVEAIIDADSASEPLDSPTSKSKFKQFYRTFKVKEKEEGYTEAKRFADECLSQLPEKIHYRIYLELADLAKRENKIREARRFYQMVSKLQPGASQGWLEFAKMEEECGNLQVCGTILEQGLHFCPINEALMVKCLKHYERIDDMEQVRILLDRLTDVPTERKWRTLMESGLLEARHGNIEAARNVFRELTEQVPWFGPVYQEACRFEEKCEDYERALEFVERGLKENVRYGPLWFSALRLQEKLQRNDKQSIQSRIEEAKKSISKELIWKLYYEAAQMEERAGHLDECREYYVLAVSYCPSNLLWKVWMSGARTELNHDNISIARKLLKRALREVPLKMKAMVLLEYSRLEEYAGKLDKAREILDKAKKYTKHEWKVFLESVLLEMRANNLQRAMEEAESALKVHTGTGRLWAVMIQLKQEEGIDEQMRVFKMALNEVPKSGEVWCEGARIAIQRDDYESAQKYISFAIQFTPQYGDSFIEYLRLEILEKGAHADFQAVAQSCANADPNYGTLWLHCKQHPLDSTKEVLRVAMDIMLDGESMDSSLQPRGFPNAAEVLLVNDIYNNVQNRSNEERRKAIFL